MRVFIPAMNRNRTFPAGGTEAKVRFLDADFQVLRKGDFVRCAVTGQPIALDDLKYWSVERQEAYATALIALERHKSLLGKE